MDPIGRNMLATGAAATVMTAALSKYAVKQSGYLKLQRRDLCRADVCTERDDRRV